MGSTNTAQPPIPPIALRPLGIGELLDRVFRLYRAQFFTLILITLLAWIPITLVSTYAYGCCRPVYILENPVPIKLLMTFSETADRVYPFPPIADVDLIIGTNHILSFVLQTLCNAALIIAISRANLGRSLPAFAAYRESLRRPWNVLLAAILQWTAIWLPTVLVMLLMVPHSVAVTGWSIERSFHSDFEHLFSILLREIATDSEKKFFPLPFLLGLPWSFCIVSLLVENLNALRAMKRSLSLLRGKIWRSLGVLLTIAIFMQVTDWILRSLLPILVALIGGIIRSPHFRMETYIVLEAAIPNIAKIFFVPLTVAATVLLYYDLRVRKEGYDLQLLAEQAATVPTPPPTA